MKEFNDTGSCIPQKHYMADTSQKLSQVIKLIEFGAYFPMNRPRQFGKTTSISLLFKILNERDDYLAIRISFEGVGDLMFEQEIDFCQGFLEVIATRLEFSHPDLAPFFEENASKTTSFKLLSKVITSFVQQQEKKVVLLIDEVDKTSNNRLFLSFLGMLRDKYLLQNEGNDSSFQSVILVGVHDIKNLKQKINPTTKREMNSPWNIAVDFKVDMTFHPGEIETMLVDYVQITDNQMDIPLIAEKIYYYTAGYPYLVSKLCKFVEEDILPEKSNKDWTPEDIDLGFRYLTRPSYQTTLFDDLAKNLLNNPDLYELVADIVIQGKKRTFSLDNPTISLANTYGILKPAQELCVVHNRIFEQRIYNLMMSLRETSSQSPDFSGVGYTQNQMLLLERVLTKFQAFMQENYAAKDIPFLEREGRLLFLSFLRPVINGQGFDFKELVVGNEKRMDVVITYFQHRYVVELKRWEGESYHQTGLQQLSDYLDLYQLKKGYLLIYDFRKNKEYKQETIHFKDKEIFAVWV